MRARSALPSLLCSEPASSSTKSSADCFFSRRFSISAWAAASSLPKLKMRAYAAYGSVSGCTGFCVPTGPACECMFQMSLFFWPTR
jgi:hypothetical protein